MFVRLIRSVSKSYTNFNADSCLMCILAFFFCLQVQETSSLNDILNSICDLLPTMDKLVHYMAAPYQCRLTQDRMRTKSITKMTCFHFKMTSHWVIMLTLVVLVRNFH